MKATMEQFGAAVRWKYPTYSQFSNKEVAEAVLAQHPQYAEVVAIEEPEKKGFLRKVGDFFTSSTQALGTTAGQVFAAPEIIESQQETEVGFLGMEDKLKRTIAENKRLGKDTSRLEKQLSDITGRQTIEKEVADIAPAIEKTGKQVIGEAIGTGVEALSGGIVSGVKGFGFSKLAPTATGAALSKAQFLAKPLSGRLKDIGVRTLKDVAIFTPFGYAMDVAQNLKEDKSGASVFKPGIATFVSALIPLSIGGLQAGRQITATALSKVVAPNFSGIPAKTYERQRVGKVVDFIGKATPENVLDDTRANAAAFKSAMQKEFGTGKEQIITEFTGKRIGLEEKIIKKLTKIAERFGFDDRLPQNLKKMSVKETMDLLAEINKVKPITQIDDPLVRSLKLNLISVKDDIRKGAMAEFGGKGGVFEKIYADYSAKSAILKDIQSIIGKVGLKPNSITLTPVQHQTATRRLQKVFNDDADNYLKAIEMLEQETGENILDKIAASQLMKFMPKSFRVNVSTIPGLGAIQSGGIGLLSDIISAVTFPLSSPRLGAWIIRKVGGYDPGIITNLLNASPALRRAIYNAVHKENTTFSDAVELYAKDYLNNPRIGLAIEDISQKSPSGMANKISATQGKSINPTINKSIVSNIDSSIAQNDKSFKGFKDLTTKFLDYAKGKSTLSRQEILDFAKRPELKKGEADLLMRKLEEFDGVSELDIVNKNYFKSYPLARNKIKLVDIEDLETGNLGFGTIKANRDKIVKEIEDTGLLPPIIDGNKVIDGNHRVEVLRELGYKKIPVIDDADAWVQEPETYAQFPWKIPEGESGKVIQQMNKLPAQEFADSIRRAEINIKSGLREGQPPIGSDWNEATKTRIDLDKTVARERFDIPNLKKVSFGGSDRDVYLLPTGEILKVAKTSRGLTQNASSVDYYAEGADLIPKTIERGKNYLIKEFVEKPDTNTKKMVSEIKEIGAFYPSVFSHADAQSNRNKAYEIMKKYGYSGDDLANYDVLWGDIQAIRNWGTKNGKPILLDEGTLFGDLNKSSEKIGGKNLSDPEFRDIYYQSRSAKKRFGDIDKKTMYGITAPFTPLLFDEE